MILKRLAGCVKRGTRETQWAIAVGLGQGRRHAITIFVSHASPSLYGICMVFSLRYLDGNLEGIAPRRILYAPGATCVHGGVSSD